MSFRTPTVIRRVWDKVLAEFPVIIELPFPKAGEVPMIIAFDTLVDWQKERVSLPEDWWVVPAAIEEEE